MKEKRITQHPILDVPERKEVEFLWNGRALRGYEGEMISSALVANDIHIFGHHPKDGSPQGLFCANGQCSQCLVIADGVPVKACMTPLQSGMLIESVEGLPELPADDEPVSPKKSPITDVDVLIIGAGPAGLSAAIELGRLGIDTLIIDDKDRVGGKLVLQTHKFFGSVEDSHAGTRGFEIASILEQEISELSSVRIWLNTTAVGVFSDGIIGAVTNKTYRMIRHKKLLVATGARERMLTFPGNTLPGVFGAGAFQTLVNRDLVKSSNRVFIIGGGNVGLIAGYHAIQAGIEVVGLAEALPQVGGYKVHADKLRRLGVPIFTSHTVVEAHGKDHVESVTIAALDEKWQIVPGSYKTFEIDTLLIAVGLTEVNEFYVKAKQWGMDAYVAGDAGEIAEASAAMFAGKIEGLKIARALGKTAEPIPQEWEEKAEILKSKPGKVSIKTPPASRSGVKPVFHCYQEIACNPCTSVCPENAIRTEGDVITGLPYIIDEEMCKGCMSCVAVCPGLAITLVDYRKDTQLPTVTLPYEIWKETVEVGQEVEVTDDDGNPLGTYPVKKVLSLKKKFPRTLLVQVQMEPEKAVKAIGIRVQHAEVRPTQTYEEALPMDEAIVCRCERVTAGEIRSAIRNGVRDINQLKAITRATMGACGSKTCRPMILRLFKEEGIDLDQVVDRVDRPLFVEVPIGTFAGVFGEEEDEQL
ncbi:MAG: FAD-dependent oxidoreductase [Deltaproteobacteria bacterium]|nr:FAD-dependent oxidoreductase [Deltaproteobacteria bacterium]MBW2081890.1 FAD-dependent oxidoreductase [Deltaproteobacteria bacterium]